MEMQGNKLVVIGTSSQEFPFASEMKKVASDGALLLCEYASAF